MICARCLHRAQATARPSAIVRTFASSATFSSTEAASPRTKGPPAATSTSAAQPFSTPLTPGPNAISAGVAQRPSAPKFTPPASSVPAGMTLKGLNFIKGRDDPVALPEEEYPQWLWGILESKTAESDSVEGDEFSKSKKVRRAAAKRQRKLEAQLLASGDEEALQPKIPIQRQTIDLPANEEGTLDGALEAVEKREEVRKAMRQERRAGIKEANYLKGMR